MTRRRVVSLTRPFGLTIALAGSLALGCTADETGEREQSPHTPATGSPGANLAPTCAVTRVVFDEQTDQLAATLVLSDPDSSSPSSAALGVSLAILTIEGAYPNHLVANTCGAQMMLNQAGNCEISSPAQGSEATFSISLSAPSSVPTGELVTVHATVTDTLGATGSCSLMLPDPRPKLLGAEDLASSTIASFAFKSITEGLLSGASGSVGEFVVGWILNQIVNGGQDPTEEIKEDIQKMQAQLEAIEVQLDQIESELSALYYQAKTNTDEVKATVAKVDVASDAYTIDTQYTLLHSGTVNPDTFAAEVLDPTKGVPFTLGIISDKMVGKGQEGVLDLLVDFLIDKARASSASPTPLSPTAALKAYLAFEYYFGYMLTVQAQGMTLVSEGYHEILASPKSPAAQLLPYGKTATQALNDYMTKVYEPQIEQQIRKFVSCSERLVAATSDLTAPPAGFLPGASTILQRADFIAEQWRQRHPTTDGRLLVRVVGEPSRVAAYADSWSSSGVSLGVEQGWDVGDGVQPLVDTRTFARQPGYAQFPPSLGMGKFTAADSIDVRSFSGAVSSSGDVTITTVNDGAVAGTVQYYDDKMQKVAGPTYEFEYPDGKGGTITVARSSILFGEALVPARQDALVAATWSCGDDGINTGQLQVSQSDTAHVGSGSIDCTTPVGPVPKSMASSLSGWVNGADNPFWVQVAGSLHAKLTFEGDSARTPTAHAAVTAWLNENDGNYMVETHHWTLGSPNPPTYQFWLSASGVMGTSESFKTSGGHTSLSEDANLGSLSPTAKPGSPLTVNASFLAKAKLDPWIFQKDLYQLMMKVQSNRLWILFQD